MNCKKCEDRKYILVNSKWRPCDCLMKYRITAQYKKSSIPPFFYDYTWDDFLRTYPNMKRTISLCKKFLKKIKEKQRMKFIYIQGEPGTGKQTLVYLLLKELITCGVTCRFMNLEEIIKMEFDKEERYELQKIYEWYNVVCLRIGTVTEHSYARLVLEKFYMTRKNNNQYGIITSRLNIEKMQGLYGIEMARMMNDGRRIFKIEMR